MGVLLVAVLAVISALSGCGSADRSASSWPEAYRMCDWLVERQTATGAIPDTEDSRWTNQDSNMEYALIALGAAFDTSGEAKYLRAMEKGIDWLFARQVASTDRWNGSYWYVYDADETDVTKHIPAGEEGIYDTRGVDATSALAVYLLWLDRALNPASTRWRDYEEKAKAALDFIIRNNWYEAEADGDGWSLSSWTQAVAGGEWTLWEYQYTADQVDVWLGLEAGFLLYGETDSRYGAKADYIRAHLGERFWDGDAGRLAIGMEGESLDTEADSFNAVFPLGYVPWAFGADAHAEDNCEWLEARVNADGSVTAGGDAFSLNVAMLDRKASCRERV